MASHIELRLQLACRDFSQTMRTEALLIPRRNPIHVCLGNAELATPALVSATLEVVPAALAGLLSWTSQCSAPDGSHADTDTGLAAQRAESTNEAAIVG